MNELQWTQWDVKRVCADAQISENTVRRYVRGQRVVRASRVVIEAAAKALGLAVRVGEAR